MERQSAQPDFYTVDSGSDWRVEYDSLTNDYNAYVIVEGRENYLGSNRRPHEARQRISDYITPDPS